MKEDEGGKEENPSATEGIDDESPQVIYLHVTLLPSLELRRHIVKNIYPQTIQSQTNPHQTTYLIMAVSDDTNTNDTHSIKTTDSQETVSKDNDLDPLSRGPPKSKYIIQYVRKYNASKQLKKIPYIVDI